LPGAGDAFFLVRHSESAATSGHGAQFNVTTGKVLRGPARRDIATYPVKVEDNAVFVSLPDE
jgi:nitrite reductase/ring-hydroxylating ferredoxin subunit